MKDNTNQNIEELQMADAILYNVFQPDQAVIYTITYNNGNTSITGTLNFNRKITLSGTANNNAQLIIRRTNTASASVNLFDSSQVLKVSNPTDFTLTNAIITVNSDGHISYTYPNNIIRQVTVTVSVINQTASSNTRPLNFVVSIDNATSLVYNSEFISIPTVIPPITGIMYGVPYSTTLQGIVTVQINTNTPVSRAILLNQNSTLTATLANNQLLLSEPSYTPLAPTPKLPADNNWPLIVILVVISLIIIALVIWLIIILTRATEPVKKTVTVDQVSM